MRLYHYCCRCSAQQITNRGFLRPSGASFFGVDLVWLTDRPVPDRAGLGLTSHTLKCDRLERQYIVDGADGEVEPWLTSDARQRLRRDDGLREFEEGHCPETWWIARRHIFAIRNKTYEHRSTT